jgi:hypothetical protein
LRAVGLPADGLIPRVPAFNLGVELGQLLAVPLTFGAGVAIARYVSRPHLARSGAFSVIADGLLAVTLVPFTEEPNPNPAQAVGAERQTRKTIATYPAGGGHGTVDFGEPGRSSTAGSPIPGPSRRSEMWPAASITPPAALPRRGRRRGRRRRR